MENKTPAPAPLNINVIKLAISGLIIIFNAYYQFILSRSSTNTRQISVSSTHLVIWILLLTGLAVAAKKIIDLKPAAHVDPATINPNLRLTLASAVFELAALMGFSSIFVFDSNIFLLSGSLFCLAGLWLIVPSK